VRRLLSAWLALAALGSGVVHLALGYSAAPPLGVILDVFGAAELGWGIVTLSIERPPIPRTWRLVVLVPIAVWAVSVVVATVSAVPAATSRLGFVPLSVATLLGLFTAAGLSVYLRWPAGRSGAGSFRGGRHLLGLIAGGLIVSLMTGAALSALPAQAQPPREGGIITPGHGGH
jgi:hypothetical protein